PRSAGAQSKDSPSEPTSISSSAADRPVSRTAARTCQPRPRSAGTSAAPTNPVAPVTSTRPRGDAASLPRAGPPAVVGSIAASARPAPDLPVHVVGVADQDAHHLLRDVV